MSQELDRAPTVCCFDDPRCISIIVPLQLRIETAPAISSIIRARSGLIFSSVIKTSCLSIEKPQSSNWSAKSQNPPVYQVEINSCHKRQCRARCRNRAWRESSLLQHFDGCCQTNENSHRGAVKPTRTRIGLLVRRESMRSPRGAPQKRWRK